MSKRSAALVLSLALATGLAACATPTPYQPNLPGQAAGGGYSEQRVESNRYRVTFTGNSLTSRETVEGYLLFRAAELTLQQGDDWFAIVDRHTERDARLQSYGYSPWYGPGYMWWRPSWRYYGGGYGWRGWDPYWGDPFWGDNVDVRLVQKYEASAEILMGKGSKPADDPRAFDAHSVVENLKPHIQYPPPPKA